MRRGGRTSCTTRRSASPACRRSARTSPPPAGPSRVRCDWHQVVITSGSQQALFLLSLLLLGSRDQAYLEDPGYVEARLACLNAGARVLPGAVDERGLLPPAPASSRIAMIYTTPSRQFPRPASRSPARRLASSTSPAARGLDRRDDYDSGCATAPAHCPRCRSRQQQRPVVYAGTFSKLLFPVAPPGIRRPAGAAARPSSP